MDPDEARRRILEELSKGEYRTGDGLIAWLLSRLDLLIQDVLTSLSHDSAAGPWVALALGALVVTVLVVALRRATRPRRRTRLTVDASLDAESSLPATELLQAAREARDAGRRDDAVLLAVRAIVRDLQERTLLEVTDGMTAHEAARAAGHPFPDMRGQLVRSADAFDTAAYSRRSVSAKQVEDAVLLAEYLMQASPDLSAESADSSTSAVAAR